MSKTSEWLERRRRVVARGVGMFSGETTAATARGASLTDADGKTFIDFAGGIGVVNAGHCDPRVVKAISEQAAKLIHGCIHVATYEPYLALCEKLAALLPHGPETKVMLVNTGAEAVENAIKIARQATKRPAVLCFEGGFHGRTLLGMTLTQKSAYKRNCGPFAPEIYRLPYPHQFKAGRGLSTDEFVKRELAGIRERFITGPVPSEHVAAIILEIVQGEGGFVPVPDGFLKGLRDICDEYGIMLIFDEVQTGFGRTGKFGAYQHFGVTPDLSTWAKSMGGGLPIGAVIGKAAVMDAAEPGTIGGTYGGNPVACAASLATIAVMEEDRLCDRAMAIGERVKKAFQKLAETSPVVGDVRGLGAMIAIEYCHDRDPSRPAGDITLKIAAECRKNGLLVLTCGPHGNVIRVLAPLVISDADLDRGLAIIDAATRAHS